MLDLSKAFAIVNHSILLTKFKAYALHISTLNWFKSYLKGRSQQTNVSGLYSNPGHVLLVFLKDLCQDLFLLYINDLPLSLTNSTADIFADDSTLSGYNYNVPDLLDSLSDDLVNVNTRCSKNRTAIHISKSKFMLILTKTNVHHLTQSCPYMQFQDTNTSNFIRKNTWCN